MKMIDLNNFVIYNEENYKTIEIELKLSKEMELNLLQFDVELNKQLKDEVRKAKLNEVDCPVFIHIKTDLLKGDRDLMRDFLFNRFISFIVGDEIPEHRERRLGIPKELFNIDLQAMAIMDLVNKYENISILNIGISTRSGKNISYAVEV